MRTYAYPATFEPADDDTTVLVTFADFPEAITEGDGTVEAYTNAADALGIVMLEYLRRGRTLPVPSTGEPLIAPEPDIAAKIALLEAFAASGITQSELARRLGWDEKAVRRALDPWHATKLPRLSAALHALGHRLVVSVEAA
ncbi:type II toxin-antitoxin system HicB family antitoxin [Pelagibacterium xiamenense]|uniref:type II toxin-antitoxin system HicB family antitoxin n=1 Tax=Pelagibacterium xiamenense TaxID=2901140 RepID=UPI001E53AAC1|nr:type II toxin-antitoxin system HicB family antitoxin [Pelagibacterium xiamenense]MCD7059442.1 type II toxin-antitoxin system HicB family antitoxin [Pelagibacterium xiamenense]